MLCPMCGGELEISICWVGYDEYDLVLVCGNYDRCKFIVFKEDRPEVFDRLNAELKNLPGDILVEKS